jgi:hypothetical protein
MNEMMKNVTTQWPGVPDAFVSKFGALCKGALCGWDRLRLRGTLRVLCYAEGMRSYLSCLGIHLKDFQAYAQALTEQVRTRAVEAAAAAGRPYRFLQSSSIDKLTIARQIALKDNLTEGVIAVFAAVEPCTATTIRLDRESGLLTPAREYRKCLHLYHYLLHPIFGLCHVRLQTWFPFEVEVWINGREWLARQMDQAGLAYVRRGNCFTQIDDLPAAQKLFERQSYCDWQKRLRALLDQTHPLHRQITRPMPYPHYYWSVNESEFSTDVMFKDADSLEALYPGWVHHGLRSFSSPDIMRYLGHVVPAASGRVNGHFKDELISSYQHRREGVRLKHRVGTNSIKMYDKAGNILRVESTVNRPQAFKILRPKIGRGKRRPGRPALAWQKMRSAVADLPARANLGRAANARYLSALASTQATTAFGPTVQDICQPITHRGRRYRGLNPLALPDATVLEFISRGEYTVQGFRNRDLQAILYRGRPATDKERRRRTGAVSRKLRLLRAHALIRKVPGRHCYLVTEDGRKKLTALLAARQADVAQLTKLAA